MRIAVCLSGQPRTWRATRASLAAFFSGHAIDVYLHTWAEGAPAEIEAMLAAYAPRGMAVAPRPLFVEEKRRLAARYPRRPPLTIFDMLHSVGESLALVEASGETYDLVARVRFDALFDGAWSGEAPGEGELIIPDFYPDASACTDQFAIGGPAEMQAYGAAGAWLAASLDSLHASALDLGEWLRPEPLLRHYLEAVCGLVVKTRPFAMKLLRETQVGRSFSEVVEDPLFHAAKHQDWEDFARARFPEVAAGADFTHPGRTALDLDRALDAWLETRPPEETAALFEAPWPARLRAIDAFLAAQTDGLGALDAQSYRSIRLICAALLQRMDRGEAMAVESFALHALSANLADMQRAAAWAVADRSRLARLDEVTRPLDVLARALDYADPLAQVGLGAWRPG